MALVAAYGDSDSDIDQEEPDETFEKDLKEPITTDVKEPLTQFDIEDEEDHWNSSVTQQKEKQDINLFSLLPQPKEKGPIVIEEADDEFMQKKVISSLIVDTESPKLATEADTKLNKRGFLNLPKPGKKKQPVKISIPTLEEVYHHIIVYVYFDMFSYDSHLRGEQVRPLK